MPEAFKANDTMIFRISFIAQNITKWSCAKSAVSWTSGAPGNKSRTSKTKKIMFHNTFIILISLKRWIGHFSYSFVEKQLKHRYTVFNKYQSDKLNCNTWHSHVQQSRDMGPPGHALLNKAYAVNSTWSQNQCSPGDTVQLNTT